MLSMQTVLLTIAVALSATTGVELIVINLIDWEQTPSLLNVN